MQVEVIILSPCRNAPTHLQQSHISKFSRRETPGPPLEGAGEWRQCLFHASFGGDFTPQKITIPPNVCQMCALNLFFGRDKELQIQGGPKKLYIFNTPYPWNSLRNKKLSYRRGTARCVVSVEILPIATQQCRNYLYHKS